MRQSEAQRIPGWFYLPEAPDEKLPGVLTWEPLEGATLELIGGFSPLPDYRPSQHGSGMTTTHEIGDVRPGAISGESAAGKRLSIWEAQRGTTTNCRNGAQGTRRVLDGILGMHRCPRR